VQEISDPRRISAGQGDQRLRGNDTTTRIAIELSSPVAFADGAEMAS
jgi:hypothetical protein